MNRELTPRRADRAYRSLFHSPWAWLVMAGGAGCWAAVIRWAVGRW